MQGAQHGVCGGTGLPQSVQDLVLLATALFVLTM